MLYVSSFLFIVRVIVSGITDPAAAHEDQVGLGNT